MLFFENNMYDCIRSNYLTFQLIARFPDITDRWECNVLGKKEINTLATIDPQNLQYSD